MFEVGKKYAYTRVDEPVVYEVLWANEYQQLVRNLDSEFVFLASLDSKLWQEYKKPIDITRYLIVYENYHSKEIEFMCVNYISEEEARHDIHPNHKIINVYPITRTIN
jgi:hypothetical protein